MFLLNNKILPLDTPFELNGNLYPANWLSLSTPLDRLAIGIVEVANITRPDDTYYWVSENPDGSYTSTPKDLDELKKNRIRQINQSAYTILQPSDWMYVKELETGIAMDATWKQWRANIRSTASAASSDVSACVTIENLIALPSINWELPPNSDVQLSSTIIQPVTQGTQTF
jgi:hypothetical protein